MKRFAVLFAAASLLILNSCALFQKENAVTQVSTIDALINGVYEDKVTLADLRSSGDFGIGTLNFIDGELLLVDGEFYRVKADGTVDQPSDEDMTPFASVAFFRNYSLQRVQEGVDYKNFKKDTDKSIETENIFYAIRLEGTFTSVKTRSVPKQEKPFKPLIEVVKKQPVFKFENVKGVMVGFRCPPFVKGINVPGYHLHFLTDDKKGGGHVLDFTVDNAKVKICRVFNFKMILPDNKAFFKTDLSINREKELKKVESDKK